MASPPKPEIGWATYRCRTHGLDLDFCADKCGSEAWERIYVVPAEVAEALAVAIEKSLHSTESEWKKWVRLEAAIVAYRAFLSAQNDEAPH